MNDFIWATLEGAALNADLRSDPHRTEEIIEFVSHIVHRVWLGTLPVPSGTFAIE